jgi:hypothetical protein
MAKTAIATMYQSRSFAIIAAGIARLRLAQSKRDQNLPLAVIATTAVGAFELREIP